MLKGSFFAPGYSLFKFMIISMIYNGHLIICIRLKYSLIRIVVLLYEQDYYHLQALVS